MAFTLTQTDADDLFLRIGQALTALRRFFVARDLLTQGLFEVQVDNDVQPATSAWRLFHVERIKHTDGDGFVHVNLTVAVGVATVDLYKDAAKTLLIGTGSGAVGTTVTVSPSGVDGLKATVLVAATATTTTDIRLRTRPAALRIVSDQFRFTADDQEARSPMTDFLRALDTRLSAESAVFFEAGIVEGLFRRLIAPTLELDPAQDLIAVRRSVADGSIQEQFTGLVPAVVDWMQKNTPAQSAVANSTSLAGVTLIGAGAGTLTAVTDSNLPVGSLELVAVAGFPSTSPEQFSVKVNPDEDFGPVEQPREVLTKDRIYRILRLGLREILLSASITQSGPGAFMFDAASWKAINVLGANTLDGTLTAWVRVVAPTPPGTQYATEIRFYRASIPSPSATILDTFASFLVASDTIFTAAAPTPLTLPTTPRTVGGTNGLSLAYKLIDVPADFANGDIATVNANPFRPGDRVVAQLSNNRAGRFATEFARFFRYPIRTSVSPTVSDGFIEPFPDFQD